MTFGARWLETLWMPAHFDVMRSIVGASLLSCAVLLACEDAAAPPARSNHILAFAVQPPVRTAPGVVLAPAPRVEVRFQNGFQTGERDTSANVDIHLALGPGQPRAKLLGTTTVRAVAGVAVFDDLSVDSSGLVALYASAFFDLEGSSQAFRVVVPFASLASGVNQSCATTFEGAAYCWGENSQQQLGVGVQPENPVRSPARVVGPPGVAFTTIGVGRVHACALTSVGSLYCWGLSDGYSLGDETAENRTVPVLVHTPGGSTFTSLSVGQYHACAIASSGTTYCWGTNFYGQLGDGSGQQPNKPVAVAAPPGVSFIQVSTGYWHTCGVTAAGAAYCWGANDYGALGDGTGDSSWVPVPVQAPGGVTFASVTAGGEHSCGLTPAGAAYCWGRGDVGQLGDSTTASSATPVPVRMPAGTRFAAISAGTFRTCATSIAGAVYCWGGPDVPTPSGTGSLTPTQLIVPDGQRIARVSLSPAYEACMLSTTGLAYCWGENNFGQMGDETQTPRPTPVAVHH